MSVSPAPLPLPSTAQEVADVIGREATLTLARSVKHRCLYVPKTTQSRHSASGERSCAWIERTIGIDLTAKLVKEFGGMQLPLARCACVIIAERRAKIRAAFEAGKTSREIALEHGISPRWVRKNYLGI